MKRKITSALAALMIGTSSCATNVQEMFMQTKALSNYEQCMDGQYDNSSRCLEDNLGEAIAGVYSMGTMALVIDKKNDSQLAINVGTGILFQGGYFLTAYHTVKESETRKPIKTLMGTEEYTIQLDMIIADNDLDFALMKVDEKISSKLKKYNLRIGKPSDLKVGNITYLIGNALRGGINTREGIVSQLKFSNPALMSVSNGGNQGDSGGPVIALRDGKIELIGMVSSKVQDSSNLTYVIRIDKILDKIKELTEGHSEKQHI
ncbi:MAG: serine protease [archaeon]